MSQKNSKHNSSDHDHRYQPPNVTNSTTASQAHPSSRPHNSIVAHAQIHQIHQTNEINSPPNVNNSSVNNFPNNEHTHNGFGNQGASFHTNYSPDLHISFTHRYYPPNNPIPWSQQQLDYQNQNHISEYQPTPRRLFQLITH